eukprot:3217155-Amphidinium_carterae.1
MSDAYFELGVCKGRMQALCLNCEEMPKIKKQPSCVKNEKKYPKDEVLSNTRFQARTLPKLEVKNHHSMNAIVLKQSWDRSFPRCAG